MKRLLPDFDTTATGYTWLDKITAPYWRWKARKEEEAFEEMLSIAREWIRDENEPVDSPDPLDLDLIPYDPPLFDRTRPPDERP